MQPCRRPAGRWNIGGLIITCPWHGAKWDIKTGKNTEFMIDLDQEPVYEVSIDGDDIYVEI